MRFESQVFWLPKDLDDSDQYQDAFAIDTQRGLAAIADGVTAGIFSGLWARILTQAIVAEPPQMEAGDFCDWLGRQRSVWRSGIDVSRLTWYQRPKMVDGGMTTLLWLQPLSPPDNSGDAVGHLCFQSFAIGDSCLFHVRNGKLLASSPMTNSADFELKPTALRSVDRDVDHLLEFQTHVFECEPGDVVVLCTDAVALWAITRYEAGETVDWQHYWGISDEAWREEILALRRDSLMRFDDSTLVLLRVLPVTADSTPESVERWSDGLLDATDAAQTASALGCEMPLSSEAHGELSEGANMLGMSNPAPDSSEPAADGPLDLARPSGVGPEASAVSAIDQASQNPHLECD